MRHHFAISVPQGPRLVQVAGLPICEERLTPWFAPTNQPLGQRLSDAWHLSHVSGVKCDKCDMKYKVGSSCRPPNLWEANPMICTNQPSVLLMERSKSFDKVGWSHLSIKKPSHCFPSSPGSVYFSRGHKIWYFQDFSRMMLAGCLGKGWNKREMGKSTIPHLSLDRGGLVASDIP